MQLMIFGYVFPSHKSVRELLDISTYNGRDAAGKRISIKNMLNEQYVMNHLGTRSRTEARKKLAALIREKGAGAGIVRLETKCLR